MGDWAEEEIRNADWEEVQKRMKRTANKPTTGEMLLPNLDKTEALLSEYLANGEAPPRVYRERIHTLALRLMEEFVKTSAYYEKKIAELEIRYRTITSPPLCQ